MKKILKVIMTLILFIFSFFYTKKAIIFLQNNDSLMKEINNKKNNYYINYTNAIITKNYMIPGISGKKINEIKSYTKMKKINYFSESLIVYDEIAPKISINNNYDKVILKGNPNIKQVGLIIDINNNLNNVNNILINNNIHIDIYSNNYINLNNLNIKNIVTDNYYHFTNYCLYNEKNINLLCQNNKKYTIKVSHIKSLQDVKNNLSNGIIFLYTINNYQDLNIIIKYLKNNNYEIKSLDKLVKE